jgi:phage terminase large subunit
LRIQLPANGWRPRPYQMGLWGYLENGGRKAVAVWHRRSGKDEVALHRIACAAFERPANYWHMLPESAQARKAIWDAVNPATGKRRIDEALPHELRSSYREQEMHIGLKSGGSYQLVGSDNYNSLVGSTPAGVVYSEWALAKPQADGYLMPILAENKGWSLYIYTPRGRNHGLTTLRAAQADPDAFAQVLTVEDTGALPKDVLEAQKRDYIAKHGEEHGESLFRQEYYCSFDAANIGAILGRAVERLEQAGRITDDVAYDPDGAPVQISSDIGFHDTASWWVWQPRVGGFAIVDYDGASGLDADDWIERIKANGYKIGKIWLPHDARAKTFQSKHSSVERFLMAFGVDKVAVVPQTSKRDRINAARRVLPSCAFHETRCFKGLEGLRDWSYEWNEDTGEFSREPLHNWASHPGDAYSYGAQVIGMASMPEADKGFVPPKTIYEATMNELWETTKQPSYQRI